MSRVPYAIRAECGHEGCREVANFEASTRKEQSELYHKYGNKQWRCLRHANVSEVLSIENRKTVFEETSVDLLYNGVSIGLYWDHYGLLFGPGFKAWAKDFPVGTKLRVTAEIILPEKLP